MERFPRGTLPPSAFAAIATIAPNAISRSPIAVSVAPLVVDPAVAPVAPVVDPIKSCDLSTTCPNCSSEMRPEHAHYKCVACGYRDSCCF